MKKTFFILTAILLTLTLGAKNYKSFKVSVYTRAYEVEKMSDQHWLDSTWDIISSQIKIDKIYLETHRDLKIVPESTLRKAIKFFKDKGLEVGGGITYTVSEPNSFETFSYSNPEHRKKVQEIAEYTARFFDDIILDDFFFTDTKSSYDIAAKGDRSWTDYRLDVMYGAGRDLVIGPAKRVNPKVKVIIKYPNWYDHFPGLGFDLQRGPYLFDGVWSGTETRDPAGNQHLQNYLSYNIIRYFDNLRPGYNFGGWVDSGGSNMGMDRYAEQLWLTMFAKAPEIALFDYRQLIGSRLNPRIHRREWQGQGTSFDYDEMMKPVALGGHKPTAGTTIARAAGYTFEKIDDVCSKLGKPYGIKSYKPFHALGEDFLQNYLGMIGLPMDMVPYFPEDQKMVFLTAQAAKDPEIVDKIEKQLERGGSVIITTGLLKAIQDKIADIAELRCDDLKALVNDFGYNGKSSKDILIPQVRYLTNDSWEVISAGRPLTGGVSGYPILHRANYLNTNLYVLTIPDDMGNLYDYPQPVLNTIRRTVSLDIPVRIDAPAKVSLFVYDNGTFIVESFLDEPVDITVTTTREGVVSITNLESGEVLAPAQPAGPQAGGFRFMRTAPNEKNFSVSLKPHSYKAFKMN